MFDGIVYAPGVFDLLHVGHIHFLRSAKNMGSTLIVGIPSDTIVKLDKGFLPVISDWQRAEMVSSLRFVDEVHCYNSLSFIPALRIYKPNVLAVGPEWGKEERHLEANKYVKELGGSVIVIPRYPHESTTAIKQRILNQKEGRP